MIFKTEAGKAAVHRKYRELLAMWPVPSEQITIPTSIGDTFVIVSGPHDGPPVLLLHGGGSTSAMWLGDVAAYAGDCRVYAVDIPGEPGLSAQARPSLKSGAYNKWLSEILDALQVPRARLVGVSLGGFLALDFATRHPGRVEKLALIVPGGIGRQKAAVALFTLLLLSFGRRGRTLALRIVLGAPVPGIMHDFVLLIYKHFCVRREPVPIVTDQALARLSMPSLTIVGERDALFDSAGTRRRLEAHAPRATVVSLPDAGHLVLHQAGRIHEFLSAGN